VLKAVAGDDATESIGAWGRSVEAILRRLFDGTVRIGMGAVATTLEECSASYRQATFCLDGKGGAAVRCIHEHDMALGYLLRELASHQAAMVLRPLAARLHPYLAKKPATKATILALFAHNFEPEATAYALGIHRNTLNYRLGRLKDLTGLDPLRRHDDAVLLRTLMALTDGD